MFGLGFQEIVVILIIALLVIGPRKLPDLAKSLGKAFREFRNATDDIKQNFDLESLTREETPAKKQPPAAGSATLKPSQDESSPQNPDGKDTQSNG